MGQSCFKKKSSDQTQKLNRRELYHTSPEAERGILREIDEKMINYQTDYINTGIKRAEIELQKLRAKEKAGNVARYESYTRLFDKAYENIRAKHADNDSISVGEIEKELEIFENERLVKKL